MKGKFSTFFQINKSFLLSFCFFLKAHNLVIDQTKRKTGIILKIFNQKVHIFSL